MTSYNLLGGALAVTNVKCKWDVTVSTELKYVQTFLEDYLISTGEKCLYYLQSCLRRPAHGLLSGSLSLATARHSECLLKI